VATPYKFDASGKITGGLLEGLGLALDPLRKSALDAYKADRANVMFGAPFEQPYAKGGGLEGLKFGSDGKLYGVLGYNQREDVPNNERERGGGTTTYQDPILALISGWEFDTSTLPKGTPGAFYDANILPDQGGNLIEVLDGGSPVGYARQRLQMAVEADSKKPGSGSKRTQTMGDSRVENPGQNR
jgi:hypothetical protein